MISLCRSIMARGDKETQQESQHSQQEGNIVWIVQRSAACPKIFYFLNALSFWRSRYEKRKGGDLLQNFLFPTCYKTVVLKSFCWGGCFANTDIKHIQHHSWFYLKLPIIRVIFSEFICEFQFHTLTIYSCLKITSD